MYLVTGATGNVGSELVDQLLASGEKVRVLTRDAAKAARWDDRVQVATGDFADVEAFAKAAAGVKGVFLMNGATDGEVFHKVVAAVKAMGVPRIVFMSSSLASAPEYTLGRLHKEKEDSIRESGVPYSVVRPGGFMSNAYQWIGTIKSQGVVYNALGEVKFPPIAPEDIAAVSAKMLTAPNGSGEVLELTGGELTNTPEQVRTLAQVLGREVHCVDVPVEAAVEGMIRSGLPPQVAKAVGESIDAVRKGRAINKTDTVERVLGRPPMTFAAWAQMHAARFS